MRYGAAFEKLGYRVSIPRQDWSAENDSGVCITLWRSEVAWGSRPIGIDTRAHCSPLEDWRSKPGNQKRKQHLKRAWTDFDGWVDVVIVDGTLGEGVDGAYPWLAQERQNCRWRVTSFDEQTGHFSADVVSLR